MARGINAAVWVFAALLAVSMLSGLGFYQLGDTGFQQPGDQTNRVLDILEDPSGSAAGGQGVVESFTVGALNGLQILWVLITNTSEVVMLFIPFQPVANMLEALARLAYGLLVVQAMLRVILE